MVSNFHLDPQKFENVYTSDYFNSIYLQAGVRTPTRIFFVYKDTSYYQEIVRKFDSYICCLETNEFTYINFLFCFLLNSNVLLLFFLQYL